MSIENIPPPGGARAHHQGAALTSPGTPTVGSFAIEVTDSTEAVYIKDAHGETVARLLDRRVAEFFVASAGIATALRALADAQPIGSSRFAVLDLETGDAILLTDSGKAAAALGPAYGLAPAST